MNYTGRQRKASLTQPHTYNVRSFTLNSTYYEPLYYERKGGEGVLTYSVGERNLIRFAGVSRARNALYSKREHTRAITITRMNTNTDPDSLTRGRERALFTAKEGEGVESGEK